jgi:hypothetical protein
VTGDRFAFTAQCGKQSEFGLTFKGTKTGTAIQGTAEMHSTGGGMTMLATTRIEGKRVGVCVAG